MQKEFDHSELKYSHISASVLRDIVLVLPVGQNVRYAKFMISLKVTLDVKKVLNIL